MPPIIPATGVPSPDRLDVNLFESKSPASVDILANSPDGSYVPGQDLTSALSGLGIGTVENEDILNNAFGAKISGANDLGKLRTVIENLISFYGPGNSNGIAISSGMAEKLMGLKIIIDTVCSHHYSADQEARKQGLIQIYQSMTKERKIIRMMDGRGEEKSIDFTGQNDYGFKNKLLELLTKEVVKAGYVDFDLTN